MRWLWMCGAALWLASSPDALAGQATPPPTSAAPPLGRIEGRFVRGDKSPAVGVTVLLCGINPLPQPQEPGAPLWSGCSSEARRTTDADGRYFFDVEPGEMFAVMG